MALTSPHWNDTFAGADDFTVTVEAFNMLAGEIDKRSLLDPATHAALA